MRYLLILIVPLFVGCTHKAVDLNVGPDGKASCQISAGPAGGDVNCLMEGPVTYHSEPLADN